MLAISEEDLHASFKQLEEHAETRKKEEEEDAEKKRRALLHSTASIKPGSTYTTKSGAVNSAWGSHAGDVILHKKAVVVVGEDDFDMDEDEENKQEGADKSGSAGSATSDKTTQPSSVATQDLLSEAQKDKEEIRSLRLALWEREEEVSRLKRELRQALEQVQRLKEAQLENQTSSSGCFSFSAKRSNIRSVSRAESRKKAL
jgi:hypothetical protein